MKRITDYLKELKHVAEISTPRPNSITVKFAQLNEETGEFDLSYYFLITITKIDFGEEAKGYAILVRSVKDRDSIHVEDEHSLLARTEEEAIEILKNIYVDFKVRRL